MPEAMHNATKQLGEDALILNSRETPADLRSHGRFEVVATVLPVASTGSNRGEGRPAVGQVPPSPEASPVAREIHLFAGLGGAGKTTCALKAAVKNGIWAGRTTAILHFDTSRIARQESLAWYCQAAGIRCLSPMELTRHEGLMELTRHQLLVIDASSMAAEGPLPDYLVELVQHPEYHGHLVAPSWASASYFMAAHWLVQRFRLRYFLPTFLDEAMLGEEAAAAAAKLDLGVRFLSSGGKVPNGLWESDESHLAELARGGQDPSGPRIAPTVGRKTLAKAAVSNMVA